MLAKFIKTVLITTFLLSALLGKAYAGALHIGSGDVEDAFGSHGLWFNSVINANGGSDNTFNFVAGTSSFTTDGMNGSLTGKVSSNAFGAAGGFDFTFNFTFVCSASTANECDGLVDVAGQPTGQAPSYDKDTWDFYNYGTTTLIGTGVLAGFDLTVTQKPNDASKPFRIGIGADWKTSGLGASTWFNIIAKTSLNGVSTNATAGDVNLSFKDGGTTITSIPEPSVIILFAIGFIGLMRTRVIK